jgi:hypothetical protein
LKFQIPLWLTLNDIKIRLKLSPNENIEGFNDLQQENQSSEDLSYELSAVGELSRIIEIRPSREINSNKIEFDRFSDMNVYLNSVKNPAQKYKGNFLYNPSDKGTKRNAEPASLSIYLNVPELAFNKFCDALVYRKISGLSVGISVNAIQDEDVGAFGPPCRDDIVYIETADDLLDCKVKLTEIVSVINGK